jgi:hypothetical protein
MYAITKGGTKCDYLVTTTNVLDFPTNNNSSDTYLHTQTIPHILCIQSVWSVHREVNTYRGKSRVQIQANVYYFMSLSASTGKTSDPF